jgi:hypothetical protein
LSFGVGRGIVIRCTLEKRHDPPGCCAGRDNRRRPRRRKGRCRPFVNAFREVLGRLTRPRRCPRGRLHHGHGTYPAQRGA